MFWFVSNNPMMIIQIFFFSSYEDLIEFTTKCIYVLQEQTTRVHGMVGRGEKGKLFVCRYGISMWELKVLNEFAHIALPLVYLCRLTLKPCPTGKKNRCLNSKWICCGSVYYFHFRIDPEIILIVEQHLMHYDVQIHGGSQYSNFSFKKVSSFSFMFFFWEVF